MIPSDLLPRVQDHPAIASLVRALVSPAPGAAVRGAGETAPRLSVPDVAKAYVLAGLHDALARPAIVLVARTNQARDLQAELCAWLPDPSRVLLFPELDTLPYEPLAADQLATGDRLEVLARLQHAGGPPPLVVASVRAVVDRLAPPERFREAAVTLEVGARIRLDELFQRLIDLGYEPTPVVDAPGQIARRGGIVDVYPVAGQACRVELFGDEIDTIRTYDPLTQRSTGSVASTLITPCQDRDAAADATLLDYLPNDGVILLDEPASLAAVAQELDRQIVELRLDLIEREQLDPDALRPYLEWLELLPHLRAHPHAELVHDPERLSIPFAQAPAFGGRMRNLTGELRRQLSEGRQVLLVTQQEQRVHELLFGTADDDGVAPDGGRHLGPTDRLAIVRGSLRGGWQSDALAACVLTDEELFGFTKIRRASKPHRTAGRQSYLSELVPGELVVHVDHGIARYRGMTRLAGQAQGMRVEPDEAAPAEREYLLLEYAEGDRLYVPADQADRVARYVGAGDAPPALTRLGGGDWTRAKARARRAVREIANELLELYAAREIVAGHAFPPDTPWQAELEGSFPFVETPDQLSALAEVKVDMESPRPMDRLLVGDVGYGKTEIALRAAFKAVMDGRQVAVLVPTTVLAQQHWNTFRERLAAFPVRVEMLSRFRSDREQQEVIKALADGSVDICIGTHRLIQRDVRFKDLGLVVVDEEQRFGVANKERLKQLRKEVDVLTLTATPIPRTLHMALVGVRDMSTIDTPPDERIPIRTFVSEYDAGLVREAILRELDRGGQVFFVHNRVQSIEVVARQLRQLVPEARFAIGHGQMPEEQLERTMLAFAAGESDVLVCTTIIESGLDIPSANTLIVNNAHRFGLSQLYQLRGRVGRGAVRAYAYFFYTRDTALTEIAEKRLRTIFEATELGAGFKIALKDLEIRGAGNLLGAEQHGQISAVGFDLYTRMLAEAVEQVRAARLLSSDSPEARTAVSRTLAALTQPSGPSVSLPLDAYISASYISDEPTRLTIYQRLAAVNDGQRLGDLVDELVDRFGPPPEPLQNLLYICSLRLAGARSGIDAIQSVDGEIVVKFDRERHLDLARLQRQVGARLRAGSNQVRLQRGSGQDWLPRLRELVDALPSA